MVEKIVFRGADERRKEIESYLKGTGVPGVKYDDFLVGVNGAVDAFGDYSTKHWVRPLAQGYAAIEAAGAAYVQEQAGNLLADLSTQGRDGAKALFTQLGTAAADAMGLPASVVAPVVQVAQKTVMDGVGEITTNLIASAGLGAMTGGLSLVAGGLLSLGLGALFEKDASPPPEPPKEKKRPLEPYPDSVGTITLAQVFEETLTAALRWRRDALGDTNYKVRETSRGLGTRPAVREYTAPFLVSSHGYTADTRRPPNKGYEFPKNDGTPLQYSDQYGAWIGFPVPWPAPEGARFVPSYRFNHDALARYVGYNVNLSLTAQNILEATLSQDPAARRGSYVPNYTKIGWAEFVVGGMMLDFFNRRRGEFDALLPLRGARGHGIVYQMMLRMKPLLPTPDPTALGEMAKDRRTPLGVLAYVTQLARAVVAGGGQLDAMAKEADEKTNHLVTVGADWQRNTLSELIASSRGADADRKRVEQRRLDEERARRQRRTVILPAAIGVVGLVGAAATWALLRRR